GPGPAAGWRRSWPCRPARSRPRPGPRPWPARAGSPGGSTRRLRGPCTPRPWPSSGSWAIPPGWPRPSTTRRSPWPATTWRGRPASVGGARRAEALSTQAFAVAGDDLEAATGLLEESLALFRQVGDEPGAARAMVMLVVRDAVAGAWDRVIARIEEAVAIWRRP